MHRTHKKPFRLLRAALLIVIAACLAKIGQACSLSAKNDAQRDELRRQKQAGEARPENGQDAEIRSSDKEGSAADGENEGQKSLLELFAKNNDLAGWLSIAGTGIDDPVMQGGDDSFYLTHDFYKKESRHGCLFVKSGADLKTPDDNVVIYGHNMKDGSMFGELDRYKKQSFFEEHPEILLETLTEDRTYEVLAAFQCDLAEDSDSFAYYQFQNAAGEEDFQEFYEQVKRLSLYDTGVTAKQGDTFLTLSTCDYYTEEGRFVVVARQKAESQSRRP